MYGTTPAFEFVSDCVRVGLVVAAVQLPAAASRQLRRLGRHRFHWTPWFLLPIALVLLGVSDLFDLDRRFLGVPAGQRWKLVSSIWAVGSLGAWLLLWLRRIWIFLYSSEQESSSAEGIGRPTRPDDPTRRRLVTAAAGAALSAPFALASYGALIGRRRFEIAEVTIRHPNLPAGLVGLSILQLTDIHLGLYLSTSDLRHVIGLANETKPHLALVTGDFITRPGDPLEKSLQLTSRLKADAGVWACLGNHELFSECEDEASELGSSLGMRFLRGQSAKLRFGGSELNLCGVDYQRQQRPYLMGAGSLLERGAFNVLMSHNPDVFPVAHQLGYDLVVAGHTHGGQVTVEIVEQWANPGRFITPYVAGPYRHGDSQLYVSRGIGTVTLPMRIGALPEITLLKLEQA